MDTADISFIHHRYRDDYFGVNTNNIFWRTFLLSIIDTATISASHRPHVMRARTFLLSIIDTATVEARDVYGWSVAADISFIHHRYRDPAQYRHYKEFIDADISFIHHRYRDSTVCIGASYFPCADISFIHHRYRDALVKFASVKSPPVRTFLLSIIDTATLAHLMDL